MYTIIIIIASSIVIFIMVAIKCQWGDYPADKTEEVIEGLWVGFLIGAIIGPLTALKIGTFFPKTYVLTETTELVALHDNSASQGNFFLGCGTMDSEFCYVFYQKEGNAVKFRKISAENYDAPIIFEEDRSDAVLQKYNERFVNEANVRWGIFIGSIKYEFHIPKGSILKNFQLDLR
jgi:hypothetical protein